MTQQDVKSAQLEHAIDEAEKAILTAQQAERLIQEASSNPDPHAIAQAQGNLQHAQHVVEEAIEKIQDTADEHREQQVVQTLDQLYAAKLDVEAAEEVIITPKQVR